MQFNSLESSFESKKLEEVMQVLELVPKPERELQKEIEKEIDRAILLEKEEEFHVLNEEEKRIEEEKQFNVKIPAPVYYNYISPSKKKELAAGYTFVPSDVQIFRVPQTVLGYNVLGCAFLGTNVVYIRDTLSGDQFEEVKRHEINHISHPWMTESQIRAKTKRELPFEANFH
jgi:hypothetical protein|tara:strand:+ start:1683 stop:2201 length:519 start_codon:yes stop_codon:yes gene_type:complete